MLQIKEKVIRDAIIIFCYPEMTCRNAKVIRKLDALCLCLCAVKTHFMLFNFSTLCHSHRHISEQHQHQQQQQQQQDQWNVREKVTATLDNMERNSSVFNSNRLRCKR